MSPVRDTMPVEVFRPSAGDREFISVTTATGMLANDALAQWTAQEIAKAAVRSAGSLEQRIKEEGAAAVARWLASKRFEVSKHNRTGRQVGAEFHTAMWEFVLTDKFPNLDAEITAYLRSFVKWCERQQPEFIGAELTVFNLAGGYAGTLDLLGVVIDHGMGILDAKTSAKTETRSGAATGPWRESAAQLEAYANAPLAAWFQPRRITARDRRTYLLSLAEEQLLQKMPPIDFTGVLHVTPRRADLYEIVPELRKREFEKFLHLLDVAEAQLGPDPIGAVIGRAA